MIKEYIPKYMENRIRSKRWGDWLFFLSGQFSLSLSLSSSFQQPHCHNIFFPTNQLEQFFFLPFRQHRHKSIATIFFLQFSATSLPKLLLNFYHFSFFPPIFGNLVATILIFSLLTALQFRQLGCHNWFPFRAFHLALRALHLAGWVLGSKNFGNEITEIQIFSPSSRHITYLFSPYFC